MYYCKLTEIVQNIKVCVLTSTYSTNSFELKDSYESMDVDKFRSTTTKASDNELL